MMDHSESQGWRESVWNRNRQERPQPMGRSRLALSSAGSLSEERSRAPRREEIGDGATSVMGLIAAPWVGPVRHRYETGNRWLMRALEWVTAKTWPLAVLDDMFSWFEEGSAASRMFLGSAAAAVMAALLSLHWATLYGLQAVTLLPVFVGHGMLALVAASFLLGATILPTVVGHVLGILLRFYVLVNLCSMAALVGYGGWLLYSFGSR